MVEGPKKGTIPVPEEDKDRVVITGQSKDFTIIFLLLIFALPAFLALPGAMIGMVFGNIPGILAIVGTYVLVYGYLIMWLRSGEIGEWRSLTIDKNGISYECRLFRKSPKIGKKVTIKWEDVELISTGRSAFFVLYPDTLWVFLKDGEFLIRDGVEVGKFELKENVFKAMKAYSKRNGIEIDDEGKWDKKKARTWIDMGRTALRDAPLFLCISLGWLLVSKILGFFDTAFPPKRASDIWCFGTVIPIFLLCVVIIGLVVAIAQWGQHHRQFVTTPQHVEEFRKALSKGTFVIEREWKKKFIAGNEWQYWTIVQRATNSRTTVKMHERPNAFEPKTASAALIYIYPVGDRNKETVKAIKRTAQIILKKENKDLLNKM